MMVKDADAARLLRRDRNRRRSSEIARARGHISRRTLSAYYRPDGSCFADDKQDVDIQLRMRRQHP